MISYDCFNNYLSISQWINGWVGEWVSAWEDGWNTFVIFLSILQCSPSLAQNTVKRIHRCIRLSNACRIYRALTKSLMCLVYQFSRRIKLSSSSDA